MKKTKSLPAEEYEDLMVFIIESLMKNGIKATSMDSLAAARQMSKRTLYEIFSTKDNMLNEVHAFVRENAKKKFKEIFDSSQNIMEAIIRCFLFNRDVIRNVSVNFFKDVHEYAQKNPAKRDKNLLHQHFMNLHEVLKKGVTEGYFIDSINLFVQCRIFSIQMESLKRMEEIFPEDISLLEVYDNIIIGFLRGISTLKGLNELDRLIPSLKSGSKVTI